MAFSLRHLIAAGLLLAAGLLPGRAEVNAPQPPPRKVRFYYIGHDSFATGLTSPVLRATYGSGKAAREIKLAAETLSPTYDYAGALPLVLFREVKEGDRVVRQTLAELSCPAGWKGVLFLVSPAPASAAFPFHFTPVEYWGDNIPENSLRLLNLCPVALAVKVAGEGKIVPVHEQIDFPVSPAAESLPFVVARGKNEGWEVVVSAARPKPESSRMLMLAFPDYPDFKTVRILQLGNLPMSPPPAGAR